MCNVTIGRLLPCKDQVSGVKRVFFVRWSDLGALTLDAGEIITEIEATTVFQYDLQPETAEFNQAPQVSVENGSQYWLQTLTLNLFKMTAIDRKEIRLMAQTRLAIFVEDMNNNMVLMGKTCTAQLSGGDGSKMGKAKADMNGYNLVFTANEPELANFVAPNTAVPFDGITTPANVTVTAGV